MSPKSLLRHPDVKSYIIDFTNGKFEEVLDDNLADVDKVMKVILTSGKIYYELIKYKNENGVKDTAILRLEQYYPFPAVSLKSILGKYKNAGEIRWVQEEPENMGALNFIRSKITEHITGGKILSFVSRKESASPAPGSYKVFADTQIQLIQKSFE